MKKRILSILLLCCMVLTLLPTAAFAADTGKAIQLGTDALSKNVNTATAPTVYFGQNHENNPAAWRVIGYDGSGVTSSQGDITLLAAGAMGVIPFVDTILNNEYAPSNLKTAIDALAAKLTTEENAAVKKRALTSGSYDGENTDCVAGGQVDNAVFWPLSAKEAIAVNNDLRALNPAHPNWVDSGWWLRSPGSDKYRLAVVRSEGSVQYSGFSVLIFNNHRTVRPAFNLNLNSVLFASAAVGGKPDGGLTPIPEYSGNEWKLTLLDSSRNFAVTEKTVSAAPDDTVTLNYKGATTGKNEYISVILADNNGAQYYGRVAQPTAKSGTVEIKIPSDIAPGDYTLKVFNEQYNGDYNTDYASNFTDIALTVENQPDEQFTLAPGGRYYFDLSAMNIPGTVNSNLPDSTLHYVPFTYAGTVNAYKLTSEMATTEEYAQKNKYPHSLFIADYAVTHTVSWDDLNTAGLIFGKNYASGGVDYTLRAPSVGSISTGSGDSQRGVPQSNEWDTMLNKNSGYIQNWNKMYSWGQDTVSFDASGRAVRGYGSARRWYYYYASYSFPFVGFRPVLEVLNTDPLISDSDRNLGDKNQDFTIEYTVNEQLKNNVVKINNIAQSIAAVNGEIAAAQGNGQSPNDLLDQRDQLIRELNQYIQTSQIPADDGTVGVFVAGSQPLVMATTATELSLQVAKEFPGSGQMALYIQRQGTQVELNEQMLGGGEMQGLLRFANQDMAEGRNLLGRLAQGMAMTMNEQHKLGRTLDGEFGKDLFAVPTSVPGYSSGTATGNVTFTDPTKFAASDYEIRFAAPPAGTPPAGVVVRLSDNATTNFTNLTNLASQQIDGLTFNLTVAGNAGERMLFKPFASTAQTIEAKIYAPKDLAAANPINAAMGTSNSGSLQLAGIQATGKPNPPGLVLPPNGDTATPPTFLGGIALQFNAGPPATYDVINQGSNPATPVSTAQPYTSGQAINIDGWQITLKGTPNAGDTVTVGNVLDPQYGDAYKRNAGNGGALMALRDVKMFDDATLQDGWANAIAQVGTRTQSAQYATNMSTTIANNLERDRLAVSGVNLDEEAAKLIQYQQAYQASAKMLQVAQSIFDNLMQTVGR